MRIEDHPDTIYWLKHNVREYIEWANSYKVNNEDLDKAVDLVFVGERLRSAMMDKGIFDDRGTMSADLTRAIASSRYRIGFMQVSDTSDSYSRVTGIHVVVEGGK